MPDTNVTTDLFPRAQAEEIAKSLRVLTLTGMGGPILGAMLDMALQMHGWPPLDLATRKFVGGPIICHGGQWGPEQNPDHPVKDYRPFILAERIEIALKMVPWTVGPTEVAMVMYAATLDAPMRNPMADLYVWAGSNAAQRRFQNRPSYLHYQGSGPDHRYITDEMVMSNSDLGRCCRELSAIIRSKVERASAVESTRNREHRPVMQAQMDDMFAQL